MYSLELLMMDGKTVRNMYSVIPKQNKFDTLVDLVGFTVEIVYMYMYIYIYIYIHKDWRGIFSHFTRGTLVQRNPDREK